MQPITANELKTRGISIVEERMADDDEVVISVRGKDRFVVMKLEKYARLREQELDLAVKEARADYDAGRLVAESVEEHMKRISDAL